MRINLTLPGLGKLTSSVAKQAKAPPPPAAPPPPPTQVDASRATARRGGPTASSATPANVQNVGGARGVGVIGSVTQALKQLTGQ